MKTRELQIAVVHDSLQTLATLNALLTELGHRMCVSATSGRQFVGSCLSQHPDLLIVKAQLPDMYGIQAAAQASQDHPIPIILILDQRDGKLIGPHDSQNLLAVLTEPVNLGDLIPAVPLVMRRFAQISELRAEKEKLQQLLADD